MDGRTVEQPTVAAFKSRSQEGIMAAKDDSKTDTGTQEKARHLSEEALEERNRGNKEEADFVLKEACELDKGAVDAVLKEKKSHC
jgi:hypothetical protein